MERFYRIACVACLVLESLSQAHNITYNYIGAASGSCSPATGDSLVVVTCDAPSGYYFMALNLEKTTDSTYVEICNGSYCYLQVKEDVMVNVTFAKRDDVRGVMWLSSDHGRISVTDSAGKNFLLAAPTGTVMRIKEMPQAGYHLDKLTLTTDGTTTTEIKRDVQTGLFLAKMPEQGATFGATFDYNIYYVYYDLNDGSDENDFRECVSITTCLIYPYNLSREGYIFQGWTLEKDDENIDNLFITKESAPSFSMVQRDSIQMYAKWFAKTTPQKKDGCYQIGDAHELYGFADIVNGTDGHAREPDACARLTADIVVNKAVFDSGYVLTQNYKRFLNWVPMGSTDTAFTGSFDGAGYKISGLYYNNPSSGNNVGLFSVVGGKEGVVLIKNLNLAGSYFAGTKNVGTLVGQVLKPSDLSVEGVLADGSVNGESNVGGLVGFVTDSTESVFDSVSFSGQVNSKNDAGGILGSAGIVNTTTKLSILRSYNASKVTAGAYGGGLVAAVYYGRVYIDGSHNEGEVYEDDSKQRLGDLYGYTYYVGGLIGHMWGDSLSIRSSYNNAAVTAKIYDGNARNQAGGLSTGEVSYLKLEDSHNSGKVSAEIATGLVTKASYGYISRSYNDGEIYSTNGSYGLLWLLSSGIIENSYNAGPVYNSKNENDGVGFFMLSSENVAVKNSHNVGTYRLMGGCYKNGLVLDNVFYFKKNSCSDSSISEYTEEGFADGTYAKLLHDYNENGVDGSVWSQRVGVDPYPVLTGGGINLPTFITLPAQTEPVSVELRGNLLLVRGATPGTRLSVSDVLGRSVLRNRVSAPDFTVKISNAGIYVVRVGSMVKSVSVENR